MKKIRRSSIPSTDESKRPERDRDLRHDGRRGRFGRTRGKAEVYRGSAYVVDFRGRRRRSSWSLRTRSSTRSSRRSWVPPSRVASATARFRSRPSTKWSASAPARRGEDAISRRRKSPSLGEPGELFPRGGLGRRGLRPLGDARLIGAKGEATDRMRALPYFVVGCARRLQRRGADRRMARSANCSTASRADDVLYSPSASTSSLCGRWPSTPCAPLTILYPYAFAELGLPLGATTYRRSRSAR